MIVGQEAKDIHIARKKAYFGETVLASFEHMTLNRCLPAA
jgi:hypothetical protein